MKTKDFIDKICKGSYCSNFNLKFGCSAYGGEECNKAFHYPHWHGKSMRERIDDYCEKHRAKNED